MGPGLRRFVVSISVSCVSLVTGVAACGGATREDPRAGKTSDPRSEDAKDASAPDAPVTIADTSVPPPDAPTDTTEHSGSRVKVEAWVATDGTVLWRDS